MRQADRTQARRRIALPHLPTRAIRVFGLSRSGNHGVIKRLLCKARCGRTPFLNSPIPFADHATIELNGTRWNHRIRRASSAAAPNTNDRRAQTRDDPLNAATAARKRADVGFRNRLAALCPQDTDAMTAQAA